MAGARQREMRPRVKGAVWAAVGYVLSPLSWWNDLFVNIPLAYLMALPFGILSRRLFLPAMVAAYWLTNIAGLVMLHKGSAAVLDPRARPMGRRALAKDLALSLLYTAAIVALIKLGVLGVPDPLLRAMGR